MTRRREIEQRLALYGELEDIMTAMKNMARAELQRVERRAKLQTQCRKEARRAVDALAHMPANLQPDVAGKAVCVCLGSERGFCGPYNELVAAAARALGARASIAAWIVVGSRLTRLLDAMTPLTPLGGATTAAEAPHVLEDIVAACDNASPGTGTLPLYVVRNTGHQAETVALLSSGTDAPGNALRFRTNVPPQSLAPALRRLYVRHALLAFHYEALAAENRTRLAQMETALRHLEDVGRTLALRRNALRQEEIVQEIETMFSLRGEAALRG